MKMSKSVLESSSTHMNYVFVYRMLYLANGYFIALQSTNRGSSILPK